MMLKVALLCLLAFNFGSSMPSLRQAPASAPVQQQSYSAPAPAPVQQQSYGAPAPAPVQQQSYAAPAPVKQQSYAAPAPVQQQSYAAPAPVQQQSQGDSAPAEQQTYRDPVADLENTCKVGYVQPIWEENAITETYCRCQDGSYGYSCSEGFKNPCNGNGQYFPADSRIPNNYFIECSWNIPYLMKCAKGTVWNQNLLTCDWTADATHETYGDQQTYDVPAPVQQQSYGAPAPVKQQSYAAPAPVQQQSYGAPVSQSAY